MRWNIKSEGKKSFPLYHMDSGSDCFCQMNVPIFLEELYGTGHVTKGAIWSALSDVVEFGVQNGILTGTIKQSWWTFLTSWSEILILELKMWLLARQCVIIQVSSDQNKTQTSWWISGTFYTLFLAFFSNSQTQLTYFSFFHILISLKSEWFWSKCSYHCLSICTKSYRTWINS